MAVAPKKRVRKNTIKSVKKRTTRKGKVTRVIHESTKEIKVDKILVDNFVALQKVMVNLSAKFDNLSGQISKLLDLFDISAKALAKKDFETAKELGGTEEIMKRLDNISQQAGLIGHGLALIHEVGQEKREEGEKRMTGEIRRIPMTQPQPQPVQRPIPQRPMPTKNPSPKLHAPPYSPGLIRPQTEEVPDQNKP